MDLNCVLKLNALVFDDISFKRLGMKSDSDLEVSFSVSIGTSMSDTSMKKVSVKAVGEKREEYTFEIQATGFFVYEGDTNDSVVQQNAVAIVMPYIRSEITLLTSQPGIEPIVLPPFNIAQMMGDDI